MPSVIYTANFIARNLPTTPRQEVINNLFFLKRYDLGDVGRYRINKKLNLEIDENIRVLTKEDIIEIIKYLIELINSKAVVDDIDHLSNRRVRTVGEQLYSQFGVGLNRMARIIRERMNVRDNEVFTPIDLINAKTISSVIQHFFRDKRSLAVHGSDKPIGCRSFRRKRRLSRLLDPADYPESALVLRCVTFTTRITEGFVLLKLQKARISVLFLLFAYMPR